MEYVLLGWPPDGPTLRLDHRQFAYAGKFVMSTTGKAVARCVECENGAGDDADDGEAGDDRADDAIDDRADDAIDDRADDGIGDRADDGIGDRADDGTGDRRRADDGPGDEGGDRRASDDGVNADDAGDDVGNVAGGGRDGGGTPPADGPAYDTDIRAAVAFNADRTDDRRLRLRYITVRSDLRGDAIGPRLAAFVAARAERRGYRRVTIAVNNPFAYEAMYKAGFEWTGRESGIAELVLERPAGTLDDDRPDPDPYRAGLDRYRDRDLGDPEASFLSDRVGASPPATLADPGGSDPDNPDA